MVSPTVRLFEPSNFLGTLLHHGKLGNMLRLSRRQTGIMVQMSSNRSRRHGIIVPQRPYVPHHWQNYFDQFNQENPIAFPRHAGWVGIVSIGVVNENFDHSVGRDDPVFANHRGPAISLRLEASPASGYVGET